MLNAGSGSLLTRKEIADMLRKKIVAKNGRKDIKKMVANDHAMMHMVRAEMIKDTFGKEIQENVQNMHVEEQIKKREFAKM